MAVTVPPIGGFRRHVCSLQAFSAIAAKDRLDPESRAVCSVTRGRLSKKLLDWCEDLYDSMADNAELTSHVTPDTLWIPVRRRLGVSNLEYRTPCCADNVAVFVGVMEHIDWDWRDPRPAPVWSDLGGWIGHFMYLYAVDVFRVHTECSDLFRAMLTRLYTRRGITEPQTLILTQALAGAGMPVDVRAHVMSLDPQYRSHLETLYQLSRYPAYRLSLAVQSGDVECVQSLSTGVVFPACWSNLVVDACHVSDPVMFEWLWEHRAVDFHVSAEDYRRILCAALSVSFAEAVRIVFQEVMVRGVDYLPWVDNLWRVTHDVECAGVLLAHGCGVPGALFRTYDPVPARYLISRQFSIVPPTPEDAGAVMAFDVRLATVLLNAWSENDLPVVEYLCAALRMCRDRSLIRELVRVFDRVCNTDGSRDGIRCQCLSHAVLNVDLRQDSSISFIRMCMSLGADLNAQDPVNGRTVLMKAALNGSPRVERFLRALTRDMASCAHHVWRVGNTQINGV